MALFVVTIRPRSMIRPIAGRRRACWTHALANRGRCCETGACWLPEATSRVETACSRGRPRSMTGHTELDADREHERPPELLLGPLAGRWTGSRRGGSHRAERHANGDGGDLRPCRGTWTLTGSMAVARGGVGMASESLRLANGNVLVAGDAVGDSASAELYDPASGTWRSVAVISVDRRDFAAVELDRRSSADRGRSDARPHRARYDRVSRTVTGRLRVHRARCARYRPRCERGESNPHALAGTGS